MVVGSEVGSQWAVRVVLGLVVPLDATDPCAENGSSFGVVRPLLNPSAAGPAIDELAASASASSPSGSTLICSPAGVDAAVAAAPPLSPLSPFPKRLRSASRSVPGAAPIDPRP